jgi:hypothetical protein
MKTMGGIFGSFIIFKKKHYLNSLNKRGKAIKVTYTLNPNLDSTKTKISILLLPLSLGCQVSW